MIVKGARGAAGARHNSITQGAPGSGAALSTRASQPAGLQLPTAPHETGAAAGAVWTRASGALEILGSSMLHGGYGFGSGGGPGSHAGSANVHYRGGSSLFSTSPPAGAAPLSDAPDEWLGPNARIADETGGAGASNGFGGGGLSDAHAAHDESGQNYYVPNYVRRAAPAGPLQPMQAAASVPMAMSIGIGIGIGPRAPSSMGAPAPLRTGSGQYLQHHPQPLPPPTEHSRRAGGGARERVRVSSGPSPSAGSGSLSLAPIVSGSGERRATRVPPVRSRIPHSGGATELRNSALGSTAAR